MPTTTANGIELYYDTFGDDADPTLLLVPGLGAQCVGFDEPFCEQLAALGVRVLRYDNRDVGLSTHLDGVEADPLTAVVAATGGQPVDAPYTLSDMAADAMGLLDVLDVPSAHVVGTSMGGMIAQTIAIEHPERVRSLTSIFSTTGEPEVGVPHPEVLAGLMSIMTPAEDRATQVAQGIELARLIGTKSTFDEDRVRARTEMFIDRAYDPAGTGRQMVAILASGSRAAELPGIGAPTVVIHGDADPLVDISGGRRTAELIPSSTFVELEGMGHDLPPQYWDRVVGGVGVAVAAATAGA
jgi:pimeloyl-ACP methyl ester carboxylesterase